MATSSLTLTSVGGTGIVGVAARWSPDPVGPDPPELLLLSLPLLLPLSGGRGTSAESNSWLPSSLLFMSFSTLTTISSSSSSSSSSPSSVMDLRYESAPAATSRASNSLPRPSSASPPPPPPPTGWCSMSTASTATLRPRKKAVPSLPPPRSSSDSGLSSAPSSRPRPDKAARRRSDPLREETRRRARTPHPVRRQSPLPSAASPAADAAAGPAAAAGRSTSAPPTTSDTFGSSSLPGSCFSSVGHGSVCVTLARSSMRVRRAGEGGLDLVLDLEEEEALVSLLSEASSLKTTRPRQVSSTGGAEDMLVASRSGKFLAFLTL